VLHNAPESEWRGSPSQDSQIRWARWKPHRFCGLESKGEGRFTIPGITRSKKELKLNYRCEPGGWISVELTDRAGERPYPDTGGVSGFGFEECDRILGDSIDRVVTWHGNSDISGIGDTVAIRLRMFQSKLFAYQI